MSRVMTRTDKVEEHHEKIRRLQAEGLDLAAAGRAYRSIGDAVSALPTEGPQHVLAKQEIARVAHEAARRAEHRSHARVVAANQLTERGVDG